MPRKGYKQTGAHRAASRKAATTRDLSTHRRIRVGEETRHTFAWRLKYKRGISVEDYARLWNEQQGMCGLCGLPMPFDGSSGWQDTVHVDHDHKTGLVRGLLHGHCNGLLGQIERVGLNHVITYLEVANA